jgi:HD-GYP domain-containing protein (c-di-GMP phosphodiesterase class II)
VSSKKVTPLREFLQGHPGALKLLLGDRENIICRNRSSGRIKAMQLRALYENNNRFWEKQDSWEYYLDRTVAFGVRERLQQMQDQARRRLAAGESGDDPIEELPEAPGGEADSTGNASRGGGVAPAGNAVGVGPAGGGSGDGIGSSGAPSAPDNFGSTYRKYKSLEQTDRVGLLQRTTERLNELASQERMDTEEVAVALVEATEDATMANRATLLEALRLGNDQAKAYTQQMVIETHKMVKSTIRLVDSEVYNDDLVRAVVERSNGTVLQHMTRVFLSGLEFLLYYNRQVITRGIANRIRIKFSQQYKEFYRKLLPHLHEDYVSLEHVFLGGMKALNEVEINKFATGFLVHDVGKAEDIEYHEGDLGYDRATVERHVKIGYRAVMEKTNYPREAALITGYHHEYYGHPAGYGYFREFLDAYKAANPGATQDYIMSYSMEPLIDYQVLAYFPAKILEIVDVFDSLTDPNRLYRSPLTPEEALMMIREQSTVQNTKIDPILYDLFVDHLAEKMGKK